MQSIIDGTISLFPQESQPNGAHQKLCSNVQKTGNAEAVKKLVNVNFLIDMSSNNKAPSASPQNAISPPFGEKMVASKNLID